MAVSEPNALEPLYPLDSCDRAILAERTARLDANRRIRVGDYVLFADGELRRVAKVYAGVVQTCDGGAFYLGERGVRMSGTLSPGITSDTLTATSLTYGGQVWFHHHDDPATRRVVHAEIAFRVYQCNQPSEDRWCRRCDARVPGRHRHGTTATTEPADQPAACGDARDGGQ